MTASLENLLDSVLADPLAQARAADCAIGYVGFDLPLELMVAPDKTFCHLPWRKGRETPRAERWLESAFPGWACSILEDWIDGVFDCFNQVVFTRGDDASQRLYYYLCELQRRKIVGGPRPLLYDVAKIPRQSSLDHCKLAIQKLMTDLGMDATNLEGAIIEANARRSLYGMLNLLRVGPGRLYEKIARAGLFRDSTNEIADAELPNTPRVPRLFLAGSVPPDESLHLAVEAAGWNVVGEMHQLSLARFGAPVDVDSGNPLSALARHYNTCPCGPRAFGDRGSRLRSEVTRTQADAVVLWQTASDEALAWHVIRQRKVLGELGVPALVLTGRRWAVDDGALDEITAFLREQAS